MTSLHEFNFQGKIQLINELEASLTDSYINQKQKDEKQ